MNDSKTYLMTISNHIDKTEYEVHGKDVDTLYDFFIHWYIGYGQHNHIRGGKVESSDQILIDLLERDRLSVINGNPIDMDLLDPMDAGCSVIIEQL